MSKTVEQIARRVLRNTILYQPVKDWRQLRHSRRQIERWVRRHAAMPVPPPHAIKEAVLREYAAQYRLRTFVETGTQHGHMLAALKTIFHTLYSIELLPEYYTKARERFATDPHIHLLLGDSAQRLPEVLNRLQAPALLWLDGHYRPNEAPEGERVTPILTELAHVFAAPDLGHVIIIDDVRLFSGPTGYPDLDDVLRRVAADGRWHVLIRHDSIRLTPRVSPAMRAVRRFFGRAG